MLFRYGFASSIISEVEFSHFQFHPFLYLNLHLFFGIYSANSLFCLNVFIFYFYPFPSFLSPLHELIQLTVLLFSSCTPPFLQVKTPDRHFHKAVRACGLVGYRQGFTLWIQGSKKNPILCAQLAWMRSFRFFPRSMW